MSKNFFDLFELETKFEIDLAKLEQQYLQFQNQFHPDKASTSEIEKSIQINEAYEALSDDFLRACHLLSLKDINILTDEKASKVDHETLVKVLELQEKISEISNKDELEELRKKINAEVKFLVAAFVKAYESNEIELAAQFIIKTKYLKKSLKDLKERKKKI